MQTKLWAAALAVTVAGPGCSRQDGGGGSQLELRVAPLDLEGIDYACYDLEVDGPDGTVVSLGTPGVSFADGDEAICSWQYGNGDGGDIAYIAPCDADDHDGDAPASADNTVTLWVDGLYRDLGSDHDPDDAQDIGDWRDPCEHGCSLVRTCRENADTAVDFNLTLLRRAQQGFFDVAVEFSDVFCSAKLDCQDALLHDPATGERGPTAVFGFACTSGQRPDGGADTTHLYLDDVRIECGDPVTKTYFLDPSRGPGQVGGQEPGLFQIAHYVGQEQLPDLEKCFWNTAIGLDDEILADVARLEDDCWLRGRGTASDVALAGGHTPGGTKYPVIEWNVQLTSASGAVVCGNNGLDEPDIGVTSTYTDWAGAGFDCQLACGTGEVTCPGRVACTDGNVPTLAGDVKLTQHGGTVLMEFGGQTWQLPIDPDYTIETCCADACCTVAPNGGNSK